MWWRTWSDETTEDWNERDRGSPSPTFGLSVSGARPKSHTLPKSQSLHEQLWEGIQRKSVDFLRGGSNLLTRTNSKEDTPGQQVGEIACQAWDVASDGFYLFR